MKKLLKYTACLAILLLAIALMTGCVDKATGGGWFYDCDGDKCTFGFNAQRTEGNVYKGQFQFQDHGNRMKIHIDEMMFFSDLGIVWFGGTDKEGKGVVVAVTDMGEPGPGAGDSIAIWYDIFDFSSPPSLLPDWVGVIEGGNIQLHEEKD